MTDIVIFNSELSTQKYITFPFNYIILWLILPFSMRNVLHKSILPPLLAVSDFDWYCHFQCGTFYTKVYYLPFHHPKAEGAIHYGQWSIQRLENTRHGTKTNKAQEYNLKLKRWATLRLNTGTGERQASSATDETWTMLICLLLFCSLLKYNEKQKILHSKKFSKCSLCS